ncbi:MAG: SufD family Fe-S cluster assembly protein [Bacteroidales bacterium]|nr:SufD family Fe-S cluster assembly protein [Bacteroidales bacterium]
MEVIRPYGESMEMEIGRGESRSLLIVNDRLQQECCNRFSFNIYGGGSLKLVMIAKNCTKLHNSITINFMEEGAECTLGGIYLPKGKERVRFETFMNHNAARCNSSQLFKGIVTDEATADFYGLIKVPQDCQQTTAYQECNHLLLSDNCRANARPQLEIYADDVKCSHGSTFGHLNQDELFYLRSRGVSLEAANKLLQEAFLAPVLEMIEPDTQY